MLLQDGICVGHIYTTFLIMVLQIMPEFSVIVTQWSEAISYAELCPFVEPEFADDVWFCKHHTAVQWFHHTAAHNLWITSGFLPHQAVVQ